MVQCHGEARMTRIRQAVPDNSRQRHAGHQRKYEFINDTDSSTFHKD
jgi:hypothetical protein